MVVCAVLCSISMLFTFSQDFCICELEIQRRSLPAGHPDVDTLLANLSAHPLPSWHPRLSEMVSRRPAVEFTVGTSVLLTRA